MKGDLFCIGGSLWRHDPQSDDPELMTKIKERCPDCSGDGCGDFDEPVSKLGRSSAWMKGAKSPPQGAKE